MFQAMLLGPMISMTGNKKVGNLLKKSNKKDLVVLTEFLEAGKITPVIDRTYPLAEVPEAIGYLENGHARGKVVITVPGGELDERR